MKQSRGSANRLPILLLCLLILAGCKEQQPPAGRSQAAAHVQTITVRTQESAASQEIMGTIQAAERAVIAAKISGRITEIPVIPGSLVKAGDLLVKIDAAEISMRLQEAKARLAQAQRNYQREKGLLAKNASTPETVRSLEDTQRIIEASVQEAKAMLDFGTITAPFPGTVTQKSANPGDLAVPGRPLLVIEGRQGLQAVANIPESLLPKLQTGAEIPVSVPAAGFSGTGRIVEISPAADPATRTAPIKLSLPDVPDLRSGQFARLSLALGKESAIVVPAAAVMPLGQMERVFVVQDGKARLRLIRTGAAADGTVEVLTGLSAGDEVVISGAEGLLDGQPVTR
jgi:membrane fusion protein (multidrug efflux system)